MAKMRFGTECSTTVSTMMAATYLAKGYESIRVT